MNNLSKTLLALAAGTVVGTVIGILIAPASGKETRKKMSDAGNELASDLKYRFRKGKEQVRDIKENIENAIDERIGDLV